VERNGTGGILAISRALGDFSVKGVNRTPAFAKYKRERDDFRLVMCCDGVFDVINNDEIGQIIAQEKDIARAAYLLRNLAFARGSHDNISALIVDLTQP
jgi:serine/threonine protein phosphatase PrpC